MADGADVESEEAEPVPAAFDLLAAGLVEMAAKAKTRRMALEDERRTVSAQYARAPENRLSRTKTRARGS